MRTLLSVLLMASVAYGQGKTTPQQGPPPKNLTQKADGHFTANQDPANPEKFEVYVVKPGDTLSVIAGQVLKNSGLWPQLWEQNEHIVNPHWIYPNDKILIKPITTITAATPPPSVEPPPPAVAPPPQAAPAVVSPFSSVPVAKVTPKPAVVFDFKKPSPVPEIKLNDLYCSGFVRKAAVPNVKVIAKYNASNGALASQNDYIYISQGAEDGVRAGARFQVIRPTRQIHDVNGKTKNARDLGMLYLDVAQIQVVTVQADYAMAQIVSSCDAVEIGDIMLPFEKLDLPAPPRSRPFSPFMTTSGGLTGSIVMTKNAMLNFGSTFKASGVIPGAETASLASVQKGVATPGEIVYVDFGDSAGAKPGDVFVVYRPLEVDTQLYGSSMDPKKLATQKTAVGELVILKVDDGVASALVTYTTIGVSAGDSVERR